MITPRERDEPNQFITKNSLGHNSKTRNFKISVDVSLRHRYQVTSYHSYCRHNDDGISDDKILGVSAGDGKFGYRSLDAIHSSSRNRVFYNSGDENLTMLDVDIGIKVIVTLPLSIMDQELVFMVEVGIGLILATLPPITQVDVVYCWFSRFILVLLMKNSW